MLKRERKMIKFPHPYLVLYVLFGLLIGFIADIVFHELGHAAVGYALNKGSVEAVYFYPPETRFTGDVFELFGHKGASLIFLGSIAAELLLWAFALAILREIRDSLKSNPSFLWPFWLFFVGFYGGLANMAYGWSGVNVGMNGFAVAPKADAVRFLAANQELIYPITYGIALIMTLYVIAPAYIFREQLIKGLRHIIG